MDMIGHVIDGRYRIEQQLGKGGMGVIFRATDLQEQHGVAVKLLHDHLMSQQSFRDRFLREAKTVSEFDHPNIVRVLQYTLSSRHFYMVMELITGGSLRDYLNQLSRDQRYLDDITAVHVIRQIARALQYAHERNVVHRDVKPENILLKPERNANSDLIMLAKLTDFGLAQLLDTVDSNASERHLGTFPYMSPEQCDGNLPIDRRTDIYSLGIVFYEITVGKLPFRPRDFYEAFRMHTQQEIELPSRIRPELPSELEEIIMRCLAKKANDRFQTAAELLATLDGLKLKNADQAEAHDTDQIQTDFGAPQSAVRQTDQVPIHETTAFQQLSAGSPDSLIIYQNDRPVRVVTLSKMVTLIGRDPRMDVVLDDRRISRENIRLERNPDGNYWIKDLSTTNQAILGDQTLESGKMTVWLYGDRLRLGSYVLELQAGNNAQAQATSVVPIVQPVPIQAAVPPAPQTQVVPQAPVQYMGAARLGQFQGQGAYRLDNVPGEEAPIFPVSLSPANLALKAGAVGEVSVELSNHSNLSEELILDVRGIPGDWATIGHSHVTLQPGETTNTTISFKPPRRWLSRAGRHTYTLRVRSISQQMEITKLTGLVHLESFSDLDVDLHPRRLQNQGVANLVIRNEGNAPGDFTITVQAHDAGLYCYPSKNHVRIDPGLNETIQIDVQADSGVLVHGAKVFNYVVKVKTSDLLERVVTGELLIVSNLLGQQQTALDVSQSMALEEFAAFPFTIPEAEVPMMTAPPADYVPPQYGLPVNPRQAQGSRGCLGLWLGFYIIVIAVLAGLLIYFMFNLGDNLSVSALILRVLGLIVGWVYLIGLAILIFQTHLFKRWALIMIMTISFFLIPIGPLLTLVWWLLVRDRWQDFA